MSSQLPGVASLSIQACWQVPLFDFGVAVHGWDEQMGQAFGLRISILPIEQCKVHLVLHSKSRHEMLLLKHEKQQRLQLSITVV